MGQIRLADNSADQPGSAARGRVKSWLAVAGVALGLPLANACAMDRVADRDLPLHHNADGTYNNPPGSPKQTAGFFDMVDLFAKMIFDFSDVRNPPGHVLPADEAKVAALAAPNPSATWLGHAAFIIRTGGKTVLTDPFLGQVAGPAGLGPRRHADAPMTAAELPPVDVLLISHNHYDHLDTETLEAIEGKDRIQAVVPLGVGAILRELGYRNVHELDWWQERRFDGLLVRMLPAIHFSGRGLFDKNKSLWGSFGLYADDARIWFSGDTGYGPVFRQIGAKEGPFDLALVAIGAFDPPVVMKPVHVSPEEAVTLLQDMRVAKGIGMHWGTIKLSLEDPFATADRFKAAARDQGYGEDNAIILSIGETYALPETAIKAAMRK